MALNPTNASFLTAFQTPSEAPVAPATISFFFFLCCRRGEKVLGAVSTLYPVPSQNSSQKYMCMKVRLKNFPRLRRTETLPQKFFMAYPHNSVLDNSRGGGAHFFNLQLFSVIPDIFLTFMLFSTVQCHHFKEITLGQILLLLGSLAEGHSVRMVALHLKIMFRHKVFVPIRSHNIHIHTLSA